MSARSGVRDEDRLLARRNGVQGGLIARVGDVDRDAELIHPPDRLTAELGQAAVPRLAQAASQRVGLAVRDAR